VCLNIGFNLVRAKGVRGKIVRAEKGHFSVEIGQAESTRL
jgi:hypothetical protein